MSSIKSISFVVPYAHLRGIKVNNVQTINLSILKVYQKLKEHLVKKTQYSFDVLCQLIGTNIIRHKMKIKHGVSIKAMKLKLYFS